MIKLNLKNILRILIVGLGIILVILAIGIAGSRVANQNRQVESTPIVSVNENQAPEENFKIVFILNKGEGQKTLKFDHILHKEKQTVFDILKELSDNEGFELKYNYNFPQLGVLVDSIADVKSGTDGKWWQYWVNEKLGEVAADKKEVKAGDIVEWRFDKADF